MRRITLAAAVAAFVSLGCAGRPLVDNPVFIRAILN